LQRHAGHLAAAEGPLGDRRGASMRVEAVARLRFPGGVAVPEVERDPANAVACTRALVADASVPAVFAGVFARDGVGVGIDVLVRRAGGLFDLVEVTAGTRVRERHATHVALQLWVLAGNGVAVDRVGLLALDRQYVHAGGAVDPMRLFVHEDLTAPARALQPRMGPQVAAMLAALDGSAPPEIPTGGQCIRPRCPFYEHCHTGEPLHPVSELPRLEPVQLDALRALAITDLRAVPADFPTLTVLQARACEVVRTGRPFRDPAIGGALGAIVRPAHFVDFETFSTAIPVHPGTRPYENVPFQWSDHVLDGDRIVHRAFLHEASDPRRAFAESLLAATVDAASVVVYSSFEADVLAALAIELPDLAPGLEALRRRIVDLLPIVRDHCYHPAFRGSFSLKAVVPALVPGLGYDDLAIRHGLAAMAAYEELVDPTTAPPRRVALRADLLAYCARDTLALVELYRTLWPGP
jgi:hypothetical protein